MGLVPMWAHLVSNSEEGVQSFIAWVDERKAIMAETAVLNAPDYATVLGLRYTIGEMESMKSLMFWVEEEEARVAAAHEGNTDGRTDG